MVNLKSLVHKLFLIQKSHNHYCCLVELFETGKVIKKNWIDDFVYMKVFMEG